MHSSAVDGFIGPPTVFGIRSAIPRTGHTRIRNESGMCSTLNTGGTDRGWSEEEMVDMKDERDRLRETGYGIDLTRFQRRRRIRKKRFTFTPTKQRTNENVG